MLVLERILQSDKITLPTRLGMKLKPRLHSVILISKDARITRPKTKIDGLDSIVKSDQFRTHIERSIDEDSIASSFMTMGKLLSRESLEDFAGQVSRLHRPLRRDWEARFGLSDAPMQSTGTMSPASVPACNTPKDQARPDDARMAITSGSPKAEMLSTSKLGAAMGLPNAAATLERLRVAGYLEWVEGSDRLTEKGHQAGGQFVEKSRYGPYFAWPKHLRC